jgi:hypothetical protein
MIINPYRFGGGATQYSRDFDGTDDYVSIPDFAHSLTNLSCMCWIKSTDSTYKSFFSHWDDNSNRSWLIQLDATDGLLCAVRGNAPPDYKIYYTPDAQDTIADGTWHHVGFTFSDDDLRLYIDGLRVPPARISAFGLNSFSTIKNSTADILIGADIASSVPANFVDSSIADCRIYDATLTEANMTTIFNGDAFSETNLVGRWITGDDEGSGSVTVFDQSANSNDGTSFGSLSVLDYPPI